jgi:hypothetical protein
MWRGVLFGVVLSFGCGGTGALDELESRTEALSPYPWNDIFSVYRSSPTTWTADYIGTGNVLCPQATVATPSCAVESLNLGGLGLSASRTQALLALVDASGASESTDQVLLKGSFAWVNNHITNRSYAEFRATAAYAASVARTHATRHLYLQNLGGAQYVTGVNAQFHLERRFDLRWAFHPHPGGVIDDAFAAGTVLFDPGTGPIVISPSPSPTPTASPTPGLFQVEQLYPRFQ